MKRTLLLATLALVTVPVYAGDKTVSEFLDLCNSPTSTANHGYCVGTIVGIGAALPVSHSTYAACITGTSDEAIAAPIIQMLNRYVEEKAARGDEQASTTVARALAVQYPCKNTY